MTASRSPAPSLRNLIFQLENAVSHSVSLASIAVGLALGWMLPSSAQASSATTTVGKAVTFAVTVNGTAPFSYQWYKNSAAIAGATGATYAIGSVTTADTANYSTKVSNPAGSTTSDLAVLTVNAAQVAPSITAQPQSVSVTAGQSAAFSVSASGSAPLAYQWNKNGALISGATSATYSLSNVSSGSAGSFAVVVSNPAGSATSNAAMLTVNAASIAPSITSQPVSQSVALGHSVSFSVVASGSAPLAYQWRKNGVNLTGATTTAYFIASVSSSDAASYSVVVSNPAGTAVSNAATLTLGTSGGTATSVWSSTTVPPILDAGADNPIELGTKVWSDVSGKIIGIRFYKSVANTGAHVANLWSESGQLLATATFRNETNSGWQQANFSAPIAIAANTTYTVSYHSRHGHYSLAQSYFTGRSVDNAPLHAPADGAFGANGVFIRCRGASLFPNQSYLGSNYWVDLVFQPTQ